MSTTIADVLAALEKRYPSASAEVWDAVGLVTGNPESPVEKVLFTVDPLEAIVNEAIEIGAQLIISHHPLFLFTDETIFSTARKTKIKKQLLNAEISLITVHTNADVAWPGVSDALASAIGIDVYGALSQVTSLGRIGKLPKPMELSDFVLQVSAGIPKTERGIHVAGDRKRSVHKVAVCGGSGSALLDQVAQTDTDIFVTSDLKYHAAEEFVNSTGKTLIDISHWAGEWPWLNQAARLLDDDIKGKITTRVSKINTDPWKLTFR